MQNDKRKVIVNFVRRWGIVLLLAVTLYCCKNESGTPGKVVIVSTNDMHAQLARFPLLATLIQQKKTEASEEILVDHKEDCVRIPMVGDIRSLNLGNSVAIVLYEALRQYGFAGMILEGHLHELHW